MLKLRTLVLFAPLVFFVAPAVATAVDGVREINQQCAIGTGCFSGDAIGFPVTISASGSYRLTGDLTNPDVDSRTIEVTADDVAIDLNGFSIVGPVTCTGSGSGLSCGAGGAGQGIYAVGASGTSVRNGFVRGVANDGLALGDNCQIEGVKAESNVGFGVSGASFCNVRNSTSSRNEGGGVSLGDAAVVSQLVAAGNRGNGMAFGAKAKLLGVESTGNDVGIVVADESLLRDCVAEGNVNYGIQVSGEGTRVESCVASDNNAGIHVLANACSVVGNTVTNNGSDGISIGTLIATNSNGVVDGNHVAGNAGVGVFVNGTNNLIVRNVAYANTQFNYFIAAGNQVGMVDSSVGASGVTGNSGGNLGATVGPWANFAR